MRTIRNFFILEVVTFKWCVRWWNSPKQPRKSKLFYYCLVMYISHVFVLWLYLSGDVDARPVFCMTVGV